MSFQSVPDCASAAIHFTQAGKDIINRLTFAKAGGYDQTDIDALAARVDATVASDWLTQIVSTCAYTGTEVKGLADLIDLSAINLDGAAAGAHNGNPLPNNVTLAMRFTTGATGRSARGRMFIVGLPDNKLDSSTDIVDNTFASAWLDAVSAMQDAAALDGWLHCVVSRFTGGSPRTTGVYRLVTAVSYFNRFSDSQRGRLPG